MEDEQEINQDVQLSIVPATADAIELLWTRLNIEVDVPVEDESRKVLLRGKVSLWVQEFRASALRLHCRQVCILTYIQLSIRVVSQVGPTLSVRSI